MAFNVKRILKNEPKKINISISTEDFNFSPFEEVFKKYKINTEKIRVTMAFNIEGDTETGLILKSKFQIKNAKFHFFRKEIRDILLSTDAFFNIQDDSILIKDFSLNTDEGLSLRSSAVISNFKENPVYTSELKINKLDLSTLNLRENLAVSGILTTDTIHIKGTFNEILQEISGTVLVSNAALKTESKKNIFKDVFINLKFQLKDKDFGFKADTNIGKISTNISGNIRKFNQKDRIIEMKIIQPEVKVTDIRDAFWDIFPDSLLYAGLDGSLSSDLSIQYSGTVLKANGELVLNDLILQGENGEYSVGPIKGTIPVSYSKTDDRKDGLLIVREKTVSPNDKKLIDMENENRKTVMKGMAKAIIRINRVPENEANMKQVMPQAVEQFASIRRDSAKKGWWIQDANGNWTKK